MRFYRAKTSSCREGGGKREMNETSATASDPHACAQEREGVVGGRRERKETETSASASNSRQLSTASPYVLPKISP